jgi:hypothetical protein
MLQSEDFTVNVTVHLIIEVKKSEKPWIIFCQKRSTRQHGFLGWGILNFRDNLPKGRLLSKTINLQNRYANSNSYGTAYTEAFKNTSETSQIYQALIGSCKAAVHVKDMISYEVGPYNPLDDHDVDFFLPITLLDGVLFKAELDNDGEIELVEAEYCPVQLNYSSQKYTENIFFPEIVTLNDFENHLKKVEIWQKHIVNSIVEKTKGSA